MWNGGKEVEIENFFRGWGGGGCFDGGFIFFGWFWSLE